MPDHFELGLAGKTLVRFEDHLVKLKDLDYRQFLKSNNPLAFGLMAKMNYNRGERVSLKADFLRWILACPVDPARRSLLVEFVETYLPLAEREQFQQIVSNSPEYEKVAQMITTYEMKGTRSQTTGAGRSEPGSEPRRDSPAWSRRRTAFLPQNRSLVQLPGNMVQHHCCRQRGPQTHGAKALERQRFFLSYPAPAT